MTDPTPPAPLSYEYVVLRCVPRPEREEFVNVGVVLHCQMADFLDARWHCDRDRLEALAPGLELDRVCAGLEFVDAVCAGDPAAGALAGESRRERFGFLKAPRSTVLQPGPVHGGLTVDPEGQLQQLLDRFVR